jgi:DNA methylase
MPRQAIQPTVRRRRGARKAHGHAEPEGVAATQEALYGRLDLALSWSEAQLPERERTKHVHRLHPYLGKFVPQLVEALIDRYVVPGGHVLDPFAGSGTTLVQSLESGRRATGIDIAGFNCLLMRVKTRRHNLDAVRRDLRWAHELASAFEPDGSPPADATPYLRAWYAPRAAAELLHYRSLVDKVASADVLRVVLARAARSARRTTHFDLDFPREPQVEPYWCHKHRRTCRPVEEARRFLLRYTLDTLDRIESFAAVRADGAHASVQHGDARELDLGGPFDAVVTSPPYPGLIDYHEQHRYAYELLGLDERHEAELGRPARGVGRDAIRAYVEGVADVLANARRRLLPGAPVCIVVNDRRDLYPEILRRAKLGLEDRLERHVNRRTGRRAGEYFESVLVCRAA